MCKEFVSITNTATCLLSLILNYESVGKEELIGKNFLRCQIFGLYEASATQAGENHPLSSCHTEIGIIEVAYLHTLGRANHYNILW